MVYDAATGSGQGEDYVSFCSKVVGEKSGRRVAINGGLGSWLKLFTGWQKKNKKLILTRQNGGGGSSQGPSLHTTNTRLKTRLSVCVKPFTTNEKARISLGQTLS